MAIKSGKMPNNSRRRRVSVQQAHASQTEFVPSPSYDLLDHWSNSLKSIYPSSTVNRVKSEFRAQFNDRRLPDLIDSYGEFQQTVQLETSVRDMSSRGRIQKRSISK